MTNRSITCTFGFFITFYFLLSTFYSQLPLSTQPVFPASQRLITPSGRVLRYLGSKKVMTLVVFLQLIVLVASVWMLKVACRSQINYYDKVSKYNGRVK